MLMFVIIIKQNPDNGDVATTLAVGLDIDLDEVPAGNGEQCQQGSDDSSVSKTV